jgi:hypothetical protein
MKLNQEPIITTNFQEDYIRDRNTLISLIKSLNYKLRFKFQTYFLAIHYMDLIFTNTKITDTNKELVAISCLMLSGKKMLLISAKYDENDPDIPNLTYVLSLLYKYYPIDELRRAEIYCIKLLSYRLNHFTFFHFNLFFMTYSCIYSDNECADIDQIEFFNKLCKYSELILLDQKLLCLDNWRLSCALIAYVREKFGLTKWNESMEREYSITLSEFQEVYDTVVGYIINNYLVRSPRRLRKLRRKGKNIYPERQVLILWIAIHLYIVINNQ